jgi:hypothetical protein
MDHSLYPSETVRISTSCGNFYITIAFDEMKTKTKFYLFHAGKAGGCASSHLTSISSVLSEIDHENLMHVLTKLTGSKCHLDNNCISAIAEYLIKVEVSLDEKGDD